MKTLYNTVQQYESILNPNQNQVMNRMTDDVENIIRQRIRKFCNYGPDSNWLVADPYLIITKIDKDNKGWYIETESSISVPIMLEETTKSPLDHFSSYGQKVDKQKGFLIEDIGVYFRWRMHRGDLLISHASSLESTDGLPEELNILSLFSCCQKSKKFTIGNNIKIITIDDVSNLKISGNGCKNVILPPNITANVTAPSGVKIHHPKNWHEYNNLVNKLGS